MNDRLDRSTHADLLSQVADCTQERDEVRRILGNALTEDEITRANGERLGDVESAVAAYKRAPWPIAPANHAHRHSRPACSRCESGLTGCTTPEACELAERAAAAPARGLASKVIDFVEIYRLYRRGSHPRRYAAQIAYGCAFQGLPF